jgi:DNA-binding transcriptional ArsR family regulator
MSNASVRHGESSPAPIFAALGDDTRLTLLGKLSQGSTASIATLATNSRLSRQAVTKHLHVLEEVGLVSSSRVGRESRFGYKPEALVEAKSYLDAVSAQWDAALERLRSFIER